jgi:hypothetical protein
MSHGIGYRRDLMVVDHFVGQVVGLYLLYRSSFPKQSSDVSLPHGCAGQLGRRRPTKLMSMIISRAPSCDCSVTRSAAIYILITGMRKLAQKTRQRDFFPVDDSTTAKKIPVSTNERITGHQCSRTRRGRGLGAV